MPVAKKMTVPIGCIQTGVLDGVSAMNHHIVTDIDANMRNAGRVIGSHEENKIAGTQGIPVDRLAAAGNVGRTALNLQAGCLAVDIADHAAAIEPGFRVLAAETITGIDQAHGVENDFVAFVAAGTGGLLCRLGCCGRTRPRAAASSKQHNDEANGHKRKKAHQAKVIS
ncbi:hypothetical protein SDC9_123026 [bioreactor metagenome]|uniref:Uncharacterized protein n=1 Tax=bioreactor metagenome TaxID=1076179 RepID=A0A645CGJ0_9ZZZZ